MRTASMCSSIFHGPRTRVYSLSNTWRERTDSSRSLIDVYAPKMLAFCTCSTGGPTRWIARLIINESERRNKSTLSSSAPKMTPGISGEYIASTKLNIAKAESIQFQSIQHPDFHRQIPENKGLASHVTFFVIDIETTGFSRNDARIIEIAIRDLRGGRNSTFQTLINPERHVPNAHIHGITTRMVNRPEVPRMKDLIPILIRYIRSRQKPGGHVVLIAHNGRIFDIPFLIREFRRCAYEIPPDWLFLDTVPLAREAMKNGSRGSKVSLQALREHYEIPMVGQAHRAMSDVNLLALIFQRITFDLKLLTPSIIGRCFRASDVQ